MFGNNITGPYISPQMPYNPMMNNAFINTANIGMRSTPMMGPMLRNVPHTGGLLSSMLGRGSTGNLISGTKSTLNFGNILNNTSKALGVVKEAIPIVKEVGPMMGNMRSMLKIASIFKDETDYTPSTSANTRNETKVSKEVNNNTEKIDTPKQDINLNNSNEPNFFL